MAAAVGSLIEPELREKKTSLVLVTRLSQFYMFVKH